MGMTVHPLETSGMRQNPFRQYLKGFAGALVPQSEVKVYKGDKLIRIETKDGKRLHRKVDQHRNGGNENEMPNNVSSSGSKISKGE